MLTALIGTLWLALVPTIDTDLRDAMVRMGLTPVAMAACGFDTESTEQFASAIGSLPELTSLEGSIAAQRSAEQALSAASKNPDLKAQVPDLSKQAANARQATKAAVDAAWVTVLDSFQDPAKHAALVAWHKSEGSGLTPELRVVDWAPDTAKKLVKALTAERRAVAGTDSLSAADSELLTQCRARSEVTNATSWIASRSAVISTQSFHLSPGGN